MQRPELRLPREFVVEYRVHLVADLLGQQCRLARWGQIPSEQSDPSAFQMEVARCVRSVEAARIVFDEAMAAYSSIELPAHFLQLPKNLQQEAHEMLKTDLECSYLSDTIFMSSGIAGSSTWNMRSVYGLFVTATSAFLTLFAKGIPIRCGLDIGLSTKLSSGEHYGPGLASAYRLESRHAQQPRIAVGEGLARFLDSVIRESRQDRLGTFASEMAKSCRQMLLHDTDGLLVLNYLDVSLLSAAARSGNDPKSLVSAAHRRITDELKAADGNDTLTRRYHAMKSFFEKHMIAIYRL